MEKYFQKRKDFYTHVVLYGEKGSWNLPFDKKNDFLLDYCTFDRQWYIAEKPGTTCPILVDVDLKRDIEPEEELENIDSERNVSLYSRQDVVDLVIHYQTILKENIIDISTDNLICFLLEKPSRLEKGVRKHGFHLHFPKIFVTISDFKYLFQKFNTFRFPLDDVSNKTWLMYGSTKTKNQQPYIATACFQDGGIEANLEYTVLSWPLEEIFSNLSVAAKLVNILSINPLGKTTLKVKYSFSAGNNRVVIYEDEDDGSCDSCDYTLLEKLVDILKPERADEYNTWWEIGIILYNVTKGSRRGLDLFHKFSKLSIKYDAKSVDDLWSHTTQSSTGKRKKLGSLIFFCRQDDANATKQIIFESRDKWIPDTDYRLAIDFHQRFPDILLYCPFNGWYKFDAHCWKCLKDETLYVIPLLIETSNWYRKRLNLTNCDEEKKQIRNVIKKLETNASQLTIIKESAHLYHIEDIHLLMNTNPYLICFQNGVYDLQALKFRDGNVQDLLSTKLPVYYKQPTREELDIFLNFFNHIFPDKELFDYFFYITCELFVGGNHDKIGQFWTGVGNNGKSVTQKLFEIMLGPFGSKLPTTVITTKKVKAGAASPELAKLVGGVRWTVFEEFNEDELINHGMFKLLTGNDSLYARALYKDGITFQPFFKLIAICNDLPRFRGDDEATWIRVRVIPFESQFCEYPPEDEHEQRRTKTFKIDKNIERHFKVMSQTLAWFLIDRLKEKRQQNVQLPIPQKVTEATKKYQLKSNRFMYFCSAVLEPCEPSEATPIEELYQMARQFWKIYFSQEILEYNEFKDGMQKLQRVQRKFFKKPMYEM